jgi:hypothetical protein
MDGPHIRAIVFIFIGAAAAFGLLWDLKGGVASDGMWQFSAVRNPAGYFAVLLMKVGFVAFAVAELLFSLSLIGDPWVTVMGFAHGLGYRAYP